MVLNAISDIQFKNDFTSFKIVKLPFAVLRIVYKL